MTLRLLTEHHLEFLSLTGSYTDSFESTFVKIPCWKSHVMAQICFLFSIFFRVMTNKMILIVIILLELGILGGVVYWKFFS